MKIYFARHGESEANELRIISNRDLPHGLTARGRLQAASLAEKIQTKSIYYIFTSPIPRAKQTAEILSGILGVPMECQDALREPDCGVLEGRSDERAWAEHNHWRERWLLGKDLESGPQDGETCEEVRKRLAEFINQLVERYGRTNLEFILVSHGALILFAVPGLVTNVDQQFILGHGIGLTALIETELEQGKLVYKAWADGFS